jgi:hypothetical protein
MRKPGGQLLVESHELLLLFELLDLIDVCEDNDRVLAIVLAEVRGMYDNVLVRLDHVVSVQTVCVVDAPLVLNVEVVQDVLDHLLEGLCGLVHLNLQEIFPHVHKRFGVVEDNLLLFRFQKCGFYHLHVLVSVDAEDLPEGPVVELDLLCLHVVKTHPVGGALVDLEPDL